MRRCIQHPSVFEHDPLITGWGWVECDTWCPEHRAEVAAKAARAHVSESSSGSWLDAGD